MGMAVILKKRTARAGEARTVAVERKKSYSAA
jgi:hypothetical protein